MAKPETPLTEAELRAFASESSDFAFEMAVLRVLRGAELESEHAATYTDPITSRIRAYDIRSRHVRPSRAVRLAVECKNLQAHNPLLVHATPRQLSEAYHSVITRVRDVALLSQQSHRRSYPETVYGIKEPVGRQTDQPFKDDKGKFKSSDSATFEKWLQAVNGCRDLLEEVVRAPYFQPQANAIVPFLVIPEGVLWQVDYDDNGKVIEPVRQVEKTTLIIRHAWTVPTGYGPLSYDISHLEIVTLPALKQRLKTSFMKAACSLVLRNS